MRTHQRFITYVRIEQLLHCIISACLCVAYQRRLDFTLCVSLDTCIIRDSPIGKPFRICQFKLNLSIEHKYISCYYFRERGTKTLSNALYYERGYFEAVA